MKVTKLLALCGLASASLAFANTPTAPAAKADPAKGKVIAEQVCAACHSADGNSAVPANPVLAGQGADYLNKQLTEFKAGVRKNPIMNGMTAALSVDDMKNLSAYFAEQKPKAREAGDKTQMPLGKTIYTGGIAATRIPACMACHGPSGNGLPVQYPRVGGQHAGYLAAQLNLFRSGERGNSQVMTDIALKMTDAQIKAVPEYMSGLR